MGGSQTLMFPDARPLVERLGTAFFRELPKRPGVYLMRDAAETVVYVGKAKNLRQRLGSYRVANPERDSRRRLRMLSTVVKIDFLECADEAAALTRETELIRELKPRFNRAGVWPAPPRHLLWRVKPVGLELRLSDKPVEEWTSHGPLKGGSAVMFAALVRFLWLGTAPTRSYREMPAGWFHGRLPEEVLLTDAEAAPLLQRLLAGECQYEELAKRVPVAWERELFAADGEAVVKYFQWKPDRGRM